MNKQIFLLCIILASYGCSKKDPSLIAWWKFDSMEDGMIRDLSGNNLNAVSHEAILTEGKHGMAFNGNGHGYLEIKHVSLMDDFKNGITIAATIKRDTSTSWNCIITREVRDNWSEYFDLGIFRNKPLFSVDSDGEHFIKTEYTKDLPVEEWINLAGTFDNKIFKLYINGKEVFSGEKKLVFSFNDENPWIIGSNTNDQGKTMHDFFFGKIDDLKIFNRALSAPEISKLNRQ